MADIDWEALRAAAREASSHAYAPYSGYRVGAAALAEDGEIYTGCNVENAGYGVTLCAECGLVSSLVAAGRPLLVAFTCVGGKGEVVTPCGRCRQLLFEHAAPALVLETPDGFRSMAEILPQAFGPQNLS